jgi:hypothetical protein
MRTVNLPLPSGAALAHEIQTVESSAQDERIRKTIAERMVIGLDPTTICVSHDDAFSASNARLTARLAKPHDK